MTRVLMALSGGVDSAVAALLLKKQGFELMGATMSVLPPDSHSHCANQKDLDTAREVARELGMEHVVLDYQAEFAERVIQNFVAAYEAGLTPNPCVECNRLMKFDLLYQAARELSCDYVATGHYVQVSKDEESQRYLLYRGKDPQKDQSYVLYSLSQEQLAHSLFPLGGLQKSEVRRLASAAGLVNQDKPESQDICFIPDGDYVKFLENYRGKPYPPGNFVNQEGEVLGQHQGIVGYTVGQRRGLGIAHREALYVKKLDSEKNEILLVEKHDLKNQGLWADRLNLIPWPQLTGKLELEAATRYQQKPVPVTVEQISPDELKLYFAEPHKAVAPGQSVVLYQGDMVVGGGRIRAGF